MSPAQIADAILAARFPEAHRTSAFHVNAHTMIVDGIERALAEHGIVGEQNALDRMRVARAVAQWHIGDGDWAPLIVDAYRKPDSARAELDAEQEDQHHALGLD